MDALGEDLEYLNSELLLLVSDPSGGKTMMRLLGAHPSVTQRIAAASPRAIGMAIRCRVPLVMFSRTLDELLAASAVSDVQSGVTLVPPRLKKLTEVTLQVAQRVALVDRTVAQVHFGFTPRACELLVNASVRRLERVASRNHVLLKMRLGEKVQFWDRLLIADRCSETLGRRLSQQAALQSLGNE